MKCAALSAAAAAAAAGAATARVATGRTALASAGTAAGRKERAAAAAGATARLGVEGSGLNNGFRSLEVVTRLPIPEVHGAIIAYESFYQSVVILSLKRK
jgi:hypothetical protein